MNAPQGPLARRLAARRGEPVQASTTVAVAEKPAERFVPVWRRNLEAKDFTGRVAL